MADILAFCSSDKVEIRMIPTYLSFTPPLLFAHCLSNPVSPRVDKKIAGCFALRIRIDAPRVRIARNVWLTHGVAANAAIKVYVSVLRSDAHFAAVHIYQAIATG